MIRALFILLLGFNSTILLSQSKLYIEYKNLSVDSLFIGSIKRIYFKVDSTAYDPSVVDIDGNKYHVVSIGTQEWTVENFRTITYNDGTSIPKVTDGTEWTNLLTGAYCAYSNDETNVTKYGYLYNWYAVNTGKLAPTTGGWRVPTDADWTKLTEFLGSSDAGTKLRATTGWYNSGNGTDDYGFSALPGGYRVINGEFHNLGDGGFWWSSTYYYENDAAWYRQIESGLTNVDRVFNYLNDGFSVRLVRDIQ